MKTLKKLVLLTVLGVGVCVNANASTIQQEIRVAVNNHQAEIANIKNSIQLNKLLAEIKAEILNILSTHENKLEHKELTLRETLLKLNPSDKFSIASHIKTILACLDSDIATTIKCAIPQVYRTILGL